MTGNTDKQLPFSLDEYAVRLGRVRKAMEEAGIDPGDDILTISVDAIPDIFLAMAEGQANATVELSPNMGGPAFDAVVAYLNGEELPDWVPVAGGIYFPDTAMEEYEARSGE